MINQNNFHQIYHTYSAQVRSLLFSYATTQEQLNDMVQETFVKIWKNRHQYNQRSTLKTWIYRVAINCALDCLRKQQRHTNFIELNERITNHQQLEPDIENQQLIKIALHSLNEKLRPVIILSIIQGLSQEEIADILTIPVGTVKSRLHKAKRELTHFFKQQGITFFEENQHKGSI